MILSISLMYLSVISHLFTLHDRDENFITSSLTGIAEWSVILPDRFDRDGNVLLPNPDP